MKLIIAIIQPAQYSAVMDVLKTAGIKGITVTDVHGVGRQGGRTVVYRGTEQALNLVPKVKLEIAVDEDDVEFVIQAILSRARSGPEGRIGDGKILVLPLEDAVRIRTGEVGTAAI